MIRRKKTTIFLDAKENTKVSDLKRMIEGITKKPPAEQRLYNKEDVVSLICLLRMSNVGNYNICFLTGIVFYSTKMLFDFQLMEDEKTLADYGLSSSLAKAQSPAEVGLSFMNDGTFEELEKTPYSSPPELPDVMKPGQETTAQEATTA